MRASQRSTSPDGEPSISVPTGASTPRIGARTARTRRRILAATVLAVASASVLAACSMGASDSTTTSGGAPANEVAPAPESLTGEVPLEGAADDAKAVAPDTRSVIQTGWVQITVQDPVAAAADTAKIAEQADGRVDERTETPGTDTQPASASLTLRIPADGLDAVVDELRELGTVTSVQMSASDVTQQQQDLDARIGALTASVDRMKTLLSGATSIADLISIESELTSRQGELDSLTQQRDWLADQIAYSTVTVDLRTEDVAPVAAPGGFWDGLLVGWNGLLLFLGWLGVALGVILPWAAAALLVAAIVVAVVRLAQAPRRRREAAAAAAEAARATEAAAQPEPAPAPVPDGTPRA